MTPNNADQHPPSVRSRPEREGRPEFLADLHPDHLITLDARPLLARGEEPFMTIMQAADRVGPGQVLKLIVPFEPVPLFAVLGRKGFAHWSQPPAEGATGAWEIFFYSAEVTTLRSPAVEETFMEEGDDEVFDLDVRGLEAPEPLERILEAAEGLSYGSVLRVRHHREPLILFDVLAERGFGFRSNQMNPDDWEIKIWRKQ